MSNFTLIRPPVFLPPAGTSSGNSSLVVTSENTRPLWFDGRFLSAGDLAREQNYFLRRQANFGRAAGSGVLHGLTIDQQVPSGQIAGADTIVIRAGVGITPSGELVMLSQDLNISLADIADAQNLDEQFGLSEAPQQPARTRTGVYVIALRPLRFTSNPIANYPASLQSPRIVRDGDIVEATGVSLVPYPNPVNNYEASLQQAALARQIFVTGAVRALSPSLLPLAMVSIDRNVIQWIDMYLVRRDTGPQSSAVRLGANDAATRQAFLLQYDARLQAVVGTPPANTKFAAASYFQALPPSGRFPLDTIDPVGLTQAFFPQGLAVKMSVIPADELPALLEASMALPPLDLTLQASVYANLSIYALIPVSRDLIAALPQRSPDPAPLDPRLPPALRGPLFPRVPFKPTAAAGGQGKGWQEAMAKMTYGFYVLRRSEPSIDVTSPPAPVQATSVRTPPPAHTPIVAAHVIKAIPSSTATPTTTPAPVPSPPASRKMPARTAARAKKKTPAKRRP